MLHLTGINHKKTPVSIREKIAFSETEVSGFINSIRGKGIISNLVLLSTCNRTEVYYTTGESCGRKKAKYIIDEILIFKKLEAGISDFFYSYSDTDAVDHLFRVSSGLDSLVLGENQILGQIKDAYSRSVGNECTDAILNKLFHKAFEIGKRVRNETGINKGASSIGYAAVELALKIFSSLERHSVLLIGLGETGMLVLRSLKQRGSSSVYITNRTYEKAVRAADEYGAQAVPFTQLFDYIAKSDIVITSTSSSSPLVTERDIREILIKRKNRYLFMIDLSVPRDIEEDVGRLENVFLYNIDSLQEVVEHNYNKRKGEIKKAEGIIRDAVPDMEKWFHTLHLTPTIRRLKERVDIIGNKRLKCYKRQVSDKEYERLEELSISIKRNIFNLIIKNLKEYSCNGKQHEFINVVNKLFELY